MNINAYMSNFLEGLHNLMSHRQRSLLGLLGIVIGTASVIMLVNIAGIVENQIMKQFQTMGTRVFTVGVQSPDENFPGFDMEKIAQLKKEHTELKQLAPYQSVDVDVNFAAKQDDQFFSVVACTPDLLDLLMIRPKKGRQFSAFDTNEPYAVVGNSLNKTSHIDLGDIIRLKNSGFSVIGINKSTEDNPLLFFFLDNTIFITLESAKSLTPKFKITSLLGVAASDSVVDSISTKLKSQLSKLYPKNNVFVRTAKTLIDQAKKQAQLLAILLAAIGSIALIVGGIGVMNVMLVSVAQRRTEIGLRVALGATRKSIQFLFLSESVTLCCIGGVIGTILGLIVSAVFAIKTDMSFIVTWFAIPTGIIISLASGILSGVYPASQAAKMNPIEALKTE